MRVAVLAGDGIGPEVTAAAVTELPRAAEIVEVHVSAQRYLTTGKLITEEEMSAIASSDALLFGAIGDPRVPDGVLERGVILRLRQELDLYVNLRPFPELDLVFVRENTEGPYSGRGARHGDVAVEESINTRMAVARCAHYAFELAARRPAGKLTWVHKTNVMSFAGSLWKEVVETVSSEYPQVEVRYEHADAAAYHLVRDPGRFDVILTDNLFGDLLSDLAAGLGNGLGTAASANLHPDPSTRPTRCIGLFEPVHGSAPDIAGTGVADARGAAGAARMLVGALEKEGASLT